MIEVGKKQRLLVDKVKNFGVYLKENHESQQDVLLPAKYVPSGTEEGDELEVFIYRDSEDRLIATTLEPAMELGETAVLEVADVGKIGAFLSWGLEKDLLLPFSEQMGDPLVKGQRVLVALYTDKSDRLCATMKVYDYLESESPYISGDRVKCIVYQFSEKLGAFAAVDGKYHGLLPNGKYSPGLKIGAETEVRVEKRRDDGKLELTQLEKKDTQMDIDADKLMKLIESYDGVLPFTEKASPQVIERELGMSKAAFKRAAGRLYKQGKISIDGGRIKIK